MKCRNCKYIETRGANEYCTYHDAYVGWHGCEYGEPKPQTNADRIRGMSDEELADFLETVNMCECGFAMGVSPCRKAGTDGCPCWLDWLQSHGGGRQWLT